MKNTIIAIGKIESQVAQQHSSNAYTLPNSPLPSIEAEAVVEPPVEGDSCPADLEGTAWGTAETPTFGLWCTDGTWQSVNLRDSEDSQSVATLGELSPPGGNCTWEYGYNLIEFNIRADASKTSTLLGEIPETASDPFVFEACEGAGWVRVDYNGILGWIYLTPGEILMDIG